MTETKTIKNSIDREALVDTFVEVKLKPEKFLQVKETLQRIGLASGRNKDKPTLLQTCVLLQKKGKYYICHFKEMFMLDGTNRSEFTEVEKIRRNKIVDMLQKWGLIESSSLTEKDLAEIQENPRLTPKVIKASEKDQWILKSNYNVGQGVKRKREKEETKK